MLKAPSGYGKSRIIREFYERIRVPAAGKPYWPSLAREQRTENRSGGIDPLPERKVLGPAPEDFVWEEGALPQFGWWNFNCELMATGRPMDLVSAAAPQLKAHAVPLRISQNHNLDAKGKLTGPVLSNFVQGFREALEGKAGDEIGNLLEEVVGSVPGLGIWVDLSARGITTVRQGLKNKSRLGGKIDVGAEVTGAAREKGEELADLVFDLSAPDLPAIVVIEDAHRLSEEFLGFLQALRISDPGRPIMVLATAWPEGANNPTYSRWVEEGTAAGTHVEVSVPDLAQSEIARIIRSFSPDLISIESAHALASRMKTPYIAKLWMTMPSVKRELAAATRSTGDTHTSGDLAQKLLGMEVPGDIKAIYKSRWEELPSSVRQALVLATSASAIEEPLAKFVPAVVSRAAERIGQDRKAMQGALDDAVEPHSWCVMEGAAEVLREELMTQVAREGREMVAVTEAELTLFREHVSEESARLLAEPSPVRQGSAAEESLLLMARSVLEQRGNIPSETAETVSARRILATAGLSAGEDSWAASMLEPVLGWTGVDSTALGMACLGLYAESIAPEDIRSAVQISARRVAGASGVYGKDAPEYWDILMEDLELRTLSVVSAETKMPDGETVSGVLHDHRRLIDEVAAALGRDSKQHLLASQNYALALLDAGERVAAMEAFRRFLVPMEQKFGALDYRTLNAKTDFVLATGRDASSTEMLPFVQDLLRDLRSEFGDADFRTIDVRRQEIFWRLRTPAQRKGLLPVIEDLIVDSATYRGPSSFAALAARAARSIYFSRSDLQEPAAQKAEQLRGVQEAEQLVGLAREIYGQSGPYYYFNQIFKNAQSYARPEKPAFKGEMRFKNRANGHSEGWKPVTAETITQAGALYASFEGAPPAPTSEAMRSKLMNEYVASMAVAVPEATTVSTLATRQEPGDTVPASSVVKVEEQRANKIVVPVKPQVVNAAPANPPKAKKESVPAVKAGKPAQKDGPAPSPEPAAPKLKPRGPADIDPYSWVPPVGRPSPTPQPLSKKKVRTGSVFAGILLAAVLAWVGLLMLPTEGIDLPGRTVFLIAGLLAVFGHASKKLKSFLSVIVLVAIGILSAVPGFPGSSTTGASVNWLAVVLGATGPFVFIAFRWFQRRSSASSTDAPRGNTAAGTHSSHS